MPKVPFFENEVPDFLQGYIIISFHTIAWMNLTKMMAGMPTHSRWAAFVGGWWNLDLSTNFIPGWGTSSSYTAMPQVIKDISNGSCAGTSIDHDNHNMNGCWDFSLYLQENGNQVERHKKAEARYELILSFWTIIISLFSFHLTKQLSHSLPLIMPTASLTCHIVVWLLSKE